MKKNILMIISMALIVSFLFLVSVQFSTAIITWVTPAQGTNHSTNISVTITFNNVTDVANPQDANTTFYYNSTGNPLFTPIDCFGFSHNGSDLTCTLNITDINNSAHITFNITLGNLSTIPNGSIVNNIIVDTTPPNVTSFLINHVAATNGLNFTSSIIALNVSVNDSLMISNTGDNVFVFFNFTNSAGVTNISLNASNSIGSVWNATFNTSWIVDGFYNLTIWANDSLGNWNSSTQSLNFAVDTTPPGITLTIDDTLTTKSTMVFNVAVSDTTGIPGSCAVDRSESTVSGAGTRTQVVTENKLECGRSYVYKVACTDVGSLSYETVATTFTTDACSSSSGSGGSGGGSSTTTVISAGNSVSVKESQISSSRGYSAKFGQDAKINFDLMSSASNAVQAHTLTVTRVGSNSATIVIASEPITLNINVGEVKKVDVDGDGVYDVSVQLNAISSGKADLTVKKIDEAASGSETGPVSDGEEATDNAKGANDEATEGSSKNMKFIWIIVLIIVVVVVAVIVYQKRK